jgi:hypothetical protein
MLYENDSARKSGPRASRKKTPSPVPGEQIRLSVRVALLCVLAIAAYTAGAAAVLVWTAGDAYQYLFHKGPVPEDLLVRTLLAGSTFFAPVFAVHQVRKVRRERRIIIGADRLQIVEGRGDDAHVLVSLPYANIESLKCTEVGYWHKLDFEVYDTNDPDTYFAGTDIETNFRTLGHHYEIMEGYQLPMDEIEDLIRRAWKKWEKAHSQRGTD